MQTLPLEQVVLTNHALRRLNGRRIPFDAVRTVMTYGRAVWVLGARVFVVGQREVRRWRDRGIDLRPFEGIHIVATAEGTVLTAYRNRNLRRLRRNSHRRRRRRPWS
ncbi:MAG: DUF4258 domain-containing protein [Chloroflexota bacterium]|nr:DUF4258 domain-containing protein [Dehalococcoidia bacterium]MDW8255190.1 DUF4258 domain-containing protein [Chloroflexota bacterium]